MPRLTLLLLMLLLSTCAGDSFDEATIPAEQIAVELAFKRLKNHGGLEPVLEVGQRIADWQFHVSTTQLDGKAEQIYQLKDRAGIDYELNVEATPREILDKISLGYGYGTGEIVGVNRDLLEAKIEAVLRLDSWREREKK